jgi:hypothetical protein
MEGSKITDYGINLINPNSSGQITKITFVIFCYYLLFLWCCSGPGAPPPPPPPTHQQKKKKTRRNTQRG